MTCHSCRTECRKFGKRANRQRYQCSQCRKVFTDARDNTLDGMYLPVEKAEMVLRLLLEGNSISSVVRLTEIHQKTILSLCSPGRNANGSWPRRFAMSKCATSRPTKY